MDGWFSVQCQCGQSQSVITVIRKKARLYIYGSASTHDLNKPITWGHFFSHGTPDPSVALARDI